ncbi:MAG: hypothetical protein JJ899_01100, partial [Alphaproteobacteria bacterium]|nr:hypothetical protein [Alphaproteobacteria bacterium]
MLRRAGEAIDWITVQYYNNPGYDAPVASHIVGATAKPRAASYAGIVAGAHGWAWPASKTMVGLPVYRDDAENGHLPPETVRRAIVCP